MDFTIEDVIERSLCVGCGACTVASNGAITMELDSTGAWKARLEAAESHGFQRASAVCPFSDDSPNEDVLADQLLDDLPSTPIIGKYRSVFAGRIVDDEREVRASSSGGLTTWLLEQMLDQGDIDGVLHVGVADAPENALFEYRISHTTEDVRAPENRRSRYYSVTMADVLDQVRNLPGRYALVGVPCFLRAARSLTCIDHELNRRLAYFVGIVCGHLKSRGFAEALAWQLGVTPEELAAVDFRVKDDTMPAIFYSFEAVATSGDRVSGKPYEIPAGNWGHGMFQLNACNYCDDIFAETADVILGDAWLPDYVHDWRGTNIVVTRSARIDELFTQGANDGSYTRLPLSTEDAINSQGGNYRHRRTGLAVRLADDLAAGEKVPRKRVAPDAETVPPVRRQMVRTRRELGPASEAVLAQAKNDGDVQVLTDGLRDLADRYDQVSRQESPNADQRPRSLRQDKQ